MFFKTSILVLTALMSGMGALHSTYAAVPWDSTTPAVCPADNPNLKERVVRLLQAPGAQAVRQRDGWANVNAANLRVLTDASHATVCQWLRTNVTFPTQDRITSYYYADGYYFVATERLRIQPPGTILLGGWEPIIVIRSNLTLVGSYAS
jgi:hypothetical protein